jgi:hypothetical protein
MLAEYRLPADGTLTFEQFKQIMLTDQTPTFGSSPSPYPRMFDAISGTPSRNRNRAYSTENRQSNLEKADSLFDTMKAQLVTRSLNPQLVRQRFPAEESNGDARLS